MFSKIYKFKELCYRQNLYVQWIKTFNLKLKLTIKHKLNSFLIFVHISLLVGEAVDLAKDFGSICEKEFPAKDLAEFVCENNSDPHTLDTRQILTAKFVV